jgi:hypothetical protein
VSIPILKRPLEIKTFKRVKRCSDKSGGYNLLLHSRLTHFVSLQLTQINSQQILIVINKYVYQYTILVGYGHEEKPSTQQKKENELYRMNLKFHYSFFFKLDVSVGISTRSI